MTTPILSDESFSVQSVPETWVEAQEEAGGYDPSPLPSNRSVGVVPMRQDADALTGTLAGLAMSVALGVTWFAVESRDVIQSPWTAVVAGVFIALAVRLGMGGRHSDIRATLSLIFYIVTVLAVAYFVESFDYREIYGVNPSFQASQTELVRDRLTQPETVVAWAMGTVACLQTSYLLRIRRLVR